MPGVLPLESENTILNLMQQAGQSFGQQCSATNTNCYYQSKFLANVVLQYRKSKLGAEVSKNPPIKQQHEEHQLQDGYGKPLLQTYQPAPTRQQQRPHHHPQDHPSLRSPAPPYYPSQNDPNSHSHPPSDLYPLSNVSTPVPPQYAGPNHLHSQQHSHHISQSDNNQLSGSMLHAAMTTTTISMHRLSNANTADTIMSNAPSSTTSVITSNNPFESLIPTMNEGPNGGGANTGASGTNYPFASFTDNGAWENLFAHAGFNINSGAFIPNLEEQ